MAGRPRKTGLSYRSSSTYKYEDFEMVDLLEKYGPLGTTIYDVISDMVLRQGYYLEVSLNTLALSVQKTIGSKWIRNKGLVLQVVQYCADIGLFDKDLLRQSVITSAELQRIYALATVRNKVQIEKYRLIGHENDKPLLSVPENDVSVTEKAISVTEIQNNESKMQRKVREGEYIDIVFPPELEKEFQLYLLIRRSNYGEILPEQENALRGDLINLTTNLEEQIAIVKKATASGWKSFYKSKDRAKKAECSEAKKTKFNNFNGRSYDMNDLERKLIEQ